MESHAYHCARLQGPLSNHFSTTYGIKFNSVLNSSSYFHVTKGVAPDVMHDVLEGVAQYEVKQLLIHLIQERLISLQCFNTQLQDFPYSYVDIKDRPTVITANVLSSSDHSMKQKGKHALFELQ